MVVDKDSGSGFDQFFQAATAGKDGVQQIASPGKAAARVEPSRALAELKAVPMGSPDDIEAYLRTMADTDKSRGDGKTNYSDDRIREIVDAVRLQIQDHPLPVEKVGQPSSIILTAKDPLSSSPEPPKRLNYGMYFVGRGQDWQVILAEMKRLNLSTRALDRAEVEREAQLMQQLEIMAKKQKEGTTNILSWPGMGTYISRVHGLVVVLPGKFSGQADTVSYMDLCSIWGSSRNPRGREGDFPITSGQCYGLEDGDTITLAPKKINYSMTVSSAAITASESRVLSPRAM